MSLFAKKTLQDIGKGIEYTGYGLLGIASIVGIIAPIVAIIAAASQEGKKSSSRDRRDHSGGGTNIFFINYNWGNPSPVNPSPVNPSPVNPSSNEPIENYFYWSIGLSVLGIILALALEVAWVALMVAGLWVAGAALLLLGQQVTAYANLQSDDVIVPSEYPVQYKTMMPEPSAPVQAAPVKAMPSAPVMQEEPEQIPPGTNTSRRSWSNWWSSLWENAEHEPGAPVPNYTPNMGLI